MNWQAMSPREVYEALRTAPRVAGAWEPAWIDDCNGVLVQRFPACRKTPDGHTVVWVLNGKVQVHAWALLGTRPWAPVEFETRDDADRFLRSVGWVLVDGPLDA